MADRDVFTRGLPRGWAGAGRALADKRIDPDGVAATAFEAVRRTLRRNAGVPKRLFRDLCTSILAAERDYREHPLLPEGSSEAYARREAVRGLCRRYKSRGALLAERADYAAAQLLVDARQSGGLDSVPVGQRLGRAILVEIFDYCLAGNIVGVMQQQGYSAQEAHERVEACRNAFLVLPQLEELARKVASRPEARRYQVKVASQPAKSQRELIVQPLGLFMAVRSESGS